LNSIGKLNMSYFLRYQPLKAGDSYLRNPVDPDFQATDFSVVAVRKSGYETTVGVRKALLKLFRSAFFEITTNYFYSYLTQYILIYKTIELFTC